MAYKEYHTVQYTEVVYYDDDDVEVYREERYDHHTYDIDGPYDVTERELEDYYE